MKKGYLVLSNGIVFEGERIGAERDTLGELVFTTGMTGYLETLTDPSYAGQIVTQTFPLIGNYGVIPEDFEGESAVRGYVVRELCGTPSNFRSRGTLDDFLKAKDIPGLCGIDTRRLTRIIREEGVMNAAIVSAPPDSLAEIRAYAVRGVVAAVSRAGAETFPAEGKKRFDVTLVDYGAKQNIIRSLTGRGCAVTVVPQDTSAEDILAAKPDGVMLSNGPGDPAENLYCIEQIRRMIGYVPIFGICLGHQLAALAMGGRTAKLKYGHRGANQPVRQSGGTRTWITSQNHGYAVLADSFKQGAAVETFVNANDGSNEGMLYPGKRCFTVQFHPEACAGPRDTGFLFDLFLDQMKGGS